MATILDQPDEVLLKQLNQLKRWDQLHAICKSNSRIHELCTNNKNTIVANVLFNKYGAPVLMHEAYWSFTNQVDLSKVTQELINLGANVTIDNNYPIRKAAKEGLLETIKVFIANNADLHAEHDDAVRQAARHGRLDVVRYLIENGANKYEDDEFLNVLYQAVYSRSLAVVEYLHTVANMDIHNDNENALNIAATEGLTSIVEYLIDNGANMIVARALTSAVIESGSLSTVRLILSRGYDVQHNDNEALFSCVDNDILEELLLHGADPNARNGQILIYAVADEYLDNVQTLVVAGANVNAQNGGPLKASIRAGQNEIIQYLIDNGADVQIDDNICLFMAAKYNRPNVLKILLENGADPNARNGDILIRAIRKSFFTNVKILVEAGARSDRAVTEVIKQNDSVILTFLHQNGYIDINSSEDDLVLMAVEYGWFRIVRFLLQNGYRMEEFDAVFAAVENDDLDSLREIVEHADVPDDILVEAKEIANDNGNLGIYSYLGEFVDSEDGNDSDD